MKPPRSEDEFREFMERIDERIRTREVPFSHRELAALSEVARELRMELPGWTADRDPRRGEFTGMDLSIRVSRWVKDRYGKRAAWDPRPGRTVVILRDDPWEIVIPRFFGSHRFFASVTEASDPVVPGIDHTDSPPRFNVLEAITDLAPGLRGVLTSAELDHVLEVFRVALEDYLLIEQLQEQPLARQAHGDLTTAVREILAGPGRYGASRWASLQAAEKMLKAYLKSTQGNHPWGHNLHDLATEAVSAGMAPVLPSWLDAARCTAAVRYAEEATTTTAAVAAHHAALDLAAHAASHLADAAPLPFDLEAS
jgi:HEPN domain-containing protein